jgi:O-phosphoseryl-tRNA(Cys) synthetase
MTKIVYNGCFGGFSLSDAGVRRYLELKGIPFTEVEYKELSYSRVRFCIADLEDGSPDYFSSYDIEDRADPVLVQVVEELREEADGDCANLLIRELDRGTRYRIQEYDGSEWVETEYDIEWQVA